MSLPTLDQDSIAEVMTWLPAWDEKDRKEEFRRDHWLRLSSSNALEPSSQNCALVCRSWLAPARRNIFRTVPILIQTRTMIGITRSAKLMSALRTRVELAAYIREVVWTLESAEFDLDSYFPNKSLELLDEITRNHHLTHTFSLQHWSNLHYLNILLLFNRAPHVADCVHKMSYHFGGTNDLESIRQEGFLSVKERVNALQHLGLRNIFERESSTEAFFPYMRLLHRMPIRSITSLHLQLCAFSSPRSFCSVLSQLESLSILKLFHIIVNKWFMEVIPEHLRAYGKAPPLKCLHYTFLGDPGADEGDVVVAHWLAAQMPPIQLVELRASDKVARLILLGSSWSSLQELTLVSTYLAVYNMESSSLLTIRAGPRGKAFPPIDLSMFTALTRLHIDCES